MIQRTTVAADEEDLQVLQEEAARRGISFARLAAEILGEKAAELRRERRPRFGVARSDGASLAAESSADEDSPAKTPPVS